MVRVCRRAGCGVCSMDPKQYGRLKKELPYFTCGRFHPPIRRIAHFAAIEYFVIDLDHFEKSDLNKLMVSETLRKDEQVVMLFTSPGGDGLKVMCKLEEKCHDAGLYSLFYKAFLRDFAQRHGLEEVIDVSTSDVSRACFLSVDDQAWYNPGATPVKLEAYFDRSDPNAQHHTERAFKELESKAPAPETRADAPLTSDVLTEIKRKLNPNFRPQKPRNIHVPEELDEVLPEIQTRMEQMNISINKVESINFGKKLTVGAGRYWAEVNVFFGKKGYSIVKTPKSGSNTDLAELTHQVLYELLVDGSGNTEQVNSGDQ